MARIRTIKPEFWLNEELSEVSAEAALLAIGLLNQSDDHGFFRANPGLLRAAIFPLRELSGSVPGMMQELADIGYIRLFEGTDGKVYGEVVNFLSHQKVNKPSPSVIKHLEQFTEDYVNGVVALPVGKERKGKERKGKEQTLVADKSATPDCPHEEIIKLYHEHCPTLAPVKVWHEQRKKALRARWRESPKHQSLEFWSGYFRYVNDSDFLTGRERSWQATLEWLVNSANFAKVIEGNYHKEQNQG